MKTTLIILGVLAVGGIITYIVLKKKSAPQMATTTSVTETHKGIEGGLAGTFQGLQIF